MITEVKGDEPAINGIQVSTDWGLTLPRVIAEIWKIESTEPSSEQRSWYEKITSKNSKKVQEALQQFGFATGDENAFFWKLTSVVFLREGEEFSFQAKTEGQYKPSDINNYSNGWNNVNGLSSTVVLTIPPVPKNLEDQALALTDYEGAGYTYPFTCCCTC